MIGSHSHLVASEVFGRRSDVVEFLVSGSCRDASIRLDFSMVGLSGVQPEAAAAVEQVVTEALDPAEAADRGEGGGSSRPA